MAFNAAIVDHLNRNVAAHRDAHAALEHALPALRDAFDSMVRFESLTVQFLQTITPLADTHYREIDDAITQLRTVTDVAQRAAMLAKREVERRAGQRCGTVHRAAPAHQPHPPHPIALASTSASKIAFAVRKTRFARGWRISCRTLPDSPTSSTSGAAAVSFSICCATPAFPRRDSI